MLRDVPLEAHLIFFFPSTTQQHFEESCTHSLYSPRPFILCFPVHDTHPSINTTEVREQYNTMQLTALLLAAAPALVAARGSLGFALGDKKADGTCKFQADYEADFAVLKDTSTLVRGYAASDCDTAKEILPAAKSAGFKVILGIWLVPKFRPWGKEGGFYGHLD